MNYYYILNEWKILIFLNEYTKNIQNGGWKNALIMAFALAPFLYYC